MIQVAIRVALSVLLLVWVSTGSRAALVTVLALQMFATEVLSYLVRSSGH